MTINQVLASLSSLTDIIRTEDEEEFIWQVLENCISELDLVDCVFYRLGAERQLVQQAAIGYKKASKRTIKNQLDIQLGKGVVGTAGKTLSRVWVRDTTMYSGYIVDMHPSSSELAIPVFQDNTLLGVIDSEHPQKDFFTDGHVELLTIISKFVASRLLQFQKSKASKAGIIAKYKSDIIHLLEEDKIYRNADLTLQRFSDVLNVSPGYLCKIIEHSFNQKYTELINSYRSKEIVSRIENGDHMRFKLIYLAFKAGFTSKSSFHLNFKKYTGKNPTQFIKEM